MEQELRVSFKLRTKSLTPDLIRTYLIQEWEYQIDEDSILIEGWTEPPTPIQHKYNLLISLEPDADNPSITRKVSHVKRNPNYIEPTEQESHPNTESNTQ